MVTEGSIDQNSQTVGSLLQKEKDRNFVGREKECYIFTRKLLHRSSIDSWKVLNIFGPAGVGKSTLISAYQSISERQDIPFLLFDTRDLASSPEAFLIKLRVALEGLGLQGDSDLSSCLASLSSLSTCRPFVLGFDTYEEIGTLDRWFRDALFPGLPQRSIVVIAGRSPLQVKWRRESSAWCQLVQPIQINSFDRDLTRNYLALHGITNEVLVNRLWNLTEGQPLALSLAVSLAKYNSNVAIEETLSDPEFTTNVTLRWLREVHCARLQNLVEAAAVCRQFNEDILQRLIEFSTLDFDKLTELTFVRRVKGGGWTLHHAIRSEIVRNLKSRSPERFRALRKKALSYYAETASRAENSRTRLGALRDFFYLAGDCTMRAALYYSDVEIRRDVNVELAGSSDFQNVRDYLLGVRDEINDPDFELYDPEAKRPIQITYPQSTPIHLSKALLEAAPDAIQLARDLKGKIHGLSVVMPINRYTVRHLKEDAISQALFTSLALKVFSEFAPEDGSTSAWYIRLVDVKDSNDHFTRSLLLNNLLAYFFRDPPIYLVSTANSFYQTILVNIGFEQVGRVTIGSENLLPVGFYLLNLKEIGLETYLHNLIEKEVSPSQCPSSPPPKEDRVVASYTPNLEIVKDTLTKRERTVALAALNGKSDKEIALQLGISLFTVKTHMNRILGKLNIQRRTQLHCALRPKEADR